MADNVNFKFEAEGLGDIQREVDATNKALQRLEKLYDQATRRGGKAAENARNLIRQQSFQVHQRGFRLVDLKERLDVATGAERSRLKRRMQSEAVGIQRIAAKGETVAAQAGIGAPLPGKTARFMSTAGRTAFAGTMVGRAGAAMAAGGPLIAGALLAGLALKKLAEAAKAASDNFTKHEIERIDVARSITGRQGFANQFFKEYQDTIGSEMRRFGFNETQGLQFADRILRQGGMRGGSDLARVANMQQDIVGGARLTRFFGLRGGEGASIIGHARRAGMAGDDLAQFLGGIGERSRETAPALRGRTGEFLTQALDYLKNISTTLDKSEKRDAVNFFTRIMGGLAKKGSEFTGAGMRQMFQSVDKVLQSGQGIVGGMFGRFLTSRVMGQEGKTQIDVLKALEQGIMAEGGQVFQDMVKEMSASTGNLDNLAVILSGETKRNFTETQAFLEIVRDLDLSKDEGLAEFKRRAAAFDPKTEADQLRAAEAARADVMLRFGEAVDIFRKVSIALGKVAEMFLKWIPGDALNLGVRTATDSLTMPGFAPLNAPSRIKDFIRDRENRRALNPNAQENVFPGMGAVGGQSTIKMPRLGTFPTLKKNVMPGMGFEGFGQQQNAQDFKEIMEYLKGLKTTDISDNSKRTLLQIYDTTGALTNSGEVETKEVHD